MTDILSHWPNISLSLVCMHTHIHIHQWFSFHVFHCLATVDFLRDSRLLARDSEYWSKLASAGNPALSVSSVWLWVGRFFGVRSIPSLTSSLCQNRLSRTSLITPILFWCLFVCLLIPSKTSLQLKGFSRKRTKLGQSCAWGFRSHFSVDWVFWTTALVHARSQAQHYSYWMHKSCGWNKKNNQGLSSGAEILFER